MRLFIPFIVLLLFVSCTGYGEKVTYNSTDVHYLPPVTQKTADKTGAYLEDMGFADGNPKSVQLTKDSLYHFRMVVQEGADTDENMEISFKALGFLLSKEVFEGEPITFQLCDNTFKTLKTLKIEGVSSTVE